LGILKFRKEKIKTCGEGEEKIKSYMRRITFSVFFHNYCHAGIS
jgi:hypothetical protein